MAKPPVSDELWKRIDPLPPLRPHHQGDRRRADKRQALAIPSRRDGILLNGPTSSHDRQTLSVARYRVPLLSRL